MLDNRTKYILVGVILVALTLTASILTSSPSSVTEAPRPNTSSPDTHDDWTFPDSEPLSPLDDFPPVIARAMPSVVSVTTETVLSSRFFGRYTEWTERTAGSGIIIDELGYIVTNHHVVENAHDIYVELYDGRTFPASVVGADYLSDLAVIKIEASDLPYSHWCDSDSLVVGERVLAIGNALGEGIIATQGIVSRLNVSVNVGGNVLYGLIQTDAAINPGNSGGPLVNMAGEVIGINSIKMVAQGVEGMGFAISSCEAKLIIPDLIRYGHVTYPWLGVGLYTVDRSLAAARDLAVDRGALIVELVSGSPADDAGLTVDDVIISFGGSEITSVADLVRAIRRSSIGEEVEVVFVRGPNTLTTTARLVERPAS